MKNRVVTAIVIAFAFKFTCICVCIGTVHVCVFAAFALWLGARVMTQVNKFNFKAFMLECLSLPLFGLLDP